MTRLDANKEGDSAEIMADPGSRLMLFDVLLGGHHPGYILHLIKYWCDWRLSGHLDIIVSSQFRNYHPDVINAALNASGNINFVAITPEEEASLSTQRDAIGRAIRAFQEWHLLSKYVRSLQPTRCLIMYFDTCQWPLALGKSLPCPFTSIYFRPTFHYKDFEGYISTWKDRMQQWREQFFLTRILANPQLKTLFCLDPFVVKYFEHFDGDAKAVHLPDPVKVYSHPIERVLELKKRLGIQTNRQIFLLFGALEGRKGIYQLLDAVSMLSPTLCERLCLLFVGPLEQTDKVKMQARISDVAQSVPIQFVVDNQFVPDQNVQLYFQLADVVLAPYQRHVGMSAILVRAAAARTPVLAQNYGLMGEVTRRYRLGITVDSTVSEEIMKGITQFLVESPETIGDRSQMQSFAEQNSSEHYARIIFEDFGYSSRNGIYSNG